MTSLKTVEKLAMDLPETERATLVANMLRSLESPLSEADGGVAEARLRDAEIDAKPSIAITLEALDQQVTGRRSR